MLAGMMIVSAAAHAGDSTGLPRIVDGDTLSPAPVRDTLCQKDRLFPAITTAIFANERESIVTSTAGEATIEFSCYR